MQDKTFTIEQGGYLPPGKLGLIFKWEGEGRPQNVLGLKGGGGFCLLSTSSVGDEPPPALGTRFDIEKLSPVPQGERG